MVKRDPRRRRRLWVGGLNPLTKLVSALLVVVAQDLWSGLHDLEPLLTPGYERFNNIVAKPVYSSITEEPDGVLDDFFQWRKSSEEPFGAALSMVRERLKEIGEA